MFIQIEISKVGNIGNSTHRTNLTCAESSKIVQALKNELPEAMIMKMEVSFSNAQ